MILPSLKVPSRKSLQSVSHKDAITFGNISEIKLLHNSLNNELT